MATLGDLRDDLRTWTSTHNNPAVLPDVVADECVNGAISLMQTAHLWRGQETTSIPLDYAANVESIVLPENFVAQRAVYQQTQDAQVPLLQYMERTIRSEFIRREQPSAGSRDPEYPQVAEPGTPTSWPVSYAIWRERLYLLPVPSQKLQLVLDYYARAPWLSDPTRANFFTMRYPHVLRYGALADAYCYLHEEERSGVYRGIFEAMLTRVILDDKNTLLAGGTIERGA